MEIDWQVGVLFGLISRCKNELQFREKNKTKFKDNLFTICPNCLIRSNDKIK